MEAAVIILGIAAVAITVGYFTFVRKHPEHAIANATGDRGGSEYFGDVNDRPGSPGAEADGVADRGSPAPGPSAEALPDRPSARP